MANADLSGGSRGHPAAASRLRPDWCHRLVRRLRPPAAALLWCLPLVTASAQAPAFLWAQAIGGLADEEPQAITVDAAGDILVAGFFSGTCSFGATNLVSGGLEDVFLAKYDPAGRLRWVRQAGGIGYDQARGVATDPAGNIFVAGLFQDTAGFGGTNLSSSGLSDLFVAKYDPAGHLLWVRGAGGRDYDEAHAVTVDRQGNAYLTGFIDANADFGSLNLVNNSGTDDGFVVKCSGTGEFLWARRLGGDLEDQGNAVAVDGATNLYVAGYFSGTASFGTTNLASAGTAGEPDLFLAKFDAAGTLRWVRQAGGDGYDAANAVVADDAGQVWVTGAFFSPAAFGGTNLTGNGADIFVASYTPAGTLLWTRRAGGNNVIYGDAGLGVALASRTNIVVTGYFSGNGFFSITSLQSTGFDDAFCAKFDAATGQPQWVRKAGGANLDAGYGVATDSFGNTYVAGFYASATLPLDGLTLTNRGGRDIFLARLGVPVIPEIDAAISDGRLVLSWPAAAFDFVLESSTNLSDSVWTEVPAGTNRVGELRVLSLPLSDTCKYFRLRK